MGVISSSMPLQCRFNALGLAPERSLNVTHGGHEASEHARRESLREADLTHQGVEARIGAERIDEWIAK